MTRSTSPFFGSTSIRMRTLEDALYPLVFNVKAAEARERFEMTLQDPNPGEYLLKITPKRDRRPREFPRGMVHP